MAGKQGGRQGGKSSDADYLWVVGIVGLAFFWPRLSGWASSKLEELAGSQVAGTVSAAVPYVIGALILGAVLLLVRGLLRGVRRKQRDMIAAIVADAVPKTWDPNKGLVVTWAWLRAAARKVVVIYPPEAPDRDPEWRMRVVRDVAYRAGMEATSVAWQPERLRVTIRRRRPEPEVPPTPEEVRRASVLTRVHLVLGPLFGTDVRVSIPEWTDDDGDPVGGYPARIEVAYDPTTRDASPSWRRRLEAVTAVKVPPGTARWTADYATAADQITLRQRPPLPENLVHPGRRLWQGQRGIVLPYAIDERGELAGWAITGPASKQRPTIHTLIIGPTGTGKTSVMRSLVVASTGQGVWVVGADPKRIELTPFRGWPGVLAVASAPEDLGLVIKAVKGLMDVRYELIERGQARPEDLVPVVLVLDEMLILRASLNRWWAANKGETTMTIWGTKTGTQHPALALVFEMLALARSANIRLVVGVQRPDASLFDDGARDNLRHRISLGRLSQQGAEMLWGDSWTGTDTPLVAGRAVASPDGGVPVEAQMYWTPDPMGSETDLIEDLRAAAEEAMTGQPFPDGLDLSALSDAARNVPEAAEAEAEAEEFVVDHTDQLSTQLVGAAAIVCGDRLLTDDGVLVTVTEVEQIENPADPELWDWVRLVLVGAEGELEEDAPASAGYSRVIET